MSKNQMIACTQVQPGQVVGFVYNGGSDPGSYRTVHVEKVDAGHIKGKVKGGAYRDFIKSKIQGADVDLVASANEEVAYPADFLTSPDQLTGETVLRVYQALHPDRKGLRFHDQARLVVVARNDLPRIEVNVNGTETMLDFINQDGAKLSIAFSNDRPMDNLSLACKMEPDDLIEFATELADHVKPKAIPLGATQGWADFASQKAAAGAPMYAGAR